MNKALKIIAVEIIIFLLLFPLGFGADMLLFANFPKDTDTAGHPVPVFTFMLPVFGAVIMAVIDLIMLVILVIKRIKKSREKRNDDRS